MIQRAGYEIEGWRLDEKARCTACGEALAGVFEPEPGTWGSRRLPLDL